MKHKIIELIRNEWKVQLEEGYSENTFKGYADKGDFHCPHRKEYDPTDGHGVSQVWVGYEEDDGELKTLEDAVDLLYKRCMEVVPGKEYPPEVEESK